MQTKTKPSPHTIEGQLAQKFGDLENCRNGSTVSRREYERRAPEDTWEKVSAKISIKDFLDHCEEEELLTHKELNTLNRIFMRYRAKVIVSPNMRIVRKKRPGTLNREILGYLTGTHPNSRRRAMSSRPTYMEPFLGIMTHSKEFKPTRSDFLGSDWHNMLLRLKNQENSLALQEVQQNPETKNPNHTAF